MIILIFSAISIIFWVPAVALLLWATTFIATSVTFSWFFVLIVSIVFSLITGFIWGALLE